MKLALPPVLAALVLATACASVGPTVPQLSKALTDRQPDHIAPEVRNVRCRSFVDEPTEYACRWRRRSPSGKWQAASSYLALDGDGFVLIDDVAVK